MSHALSSTFVIHRPRITSRERYLSNKQHATMNRREEGTSDGTISGFIFAFKSELKCVCYGSEGLVAKINIIRPRNNAQWDSVQVTSIFTAQFHWAISIFKLWDSLLAPSLQAASPLLFIKCLLAPVFCTAPSTGSSSNKERRINQLLRPTAKL